MCFRYLAQDKFWEDSSPRKEEEEEESHTHDPEGASLVRPESNAGQVESMSVSEDTSASSLSATEKETKESAIDSESDPEKEENGFSPRTTPQRGSFLLSKEGEEESAPDLATGESDKENLASNFGSRLSLISKTSSTSSTEAKKTTKKKKGRTQKRSERMVERFKRMSSLGKSSHRHPRANGIGEEAQPDIHAFSKELEGLLEVEEAESLGASSEKELIRRVSSKFVSVSKGG